MGFWQIGTDVLARSRFVVSPLAETVACLAALGGQHAVSAPQREWLAAHRAAFEARYAGDPFVRPFLHAAIRPGWIADFLVTPPRTPGETFQTELARLRRTPDATARTHLGLGDVVPDVLRSDGLAGRAADLVDWVWSHLVRPGWPRRGRRVGGGQGAAPPPARTARPGRMSFNFKARWEDPPPRRWGCRPPRQDETCQGWPA